MEKQESYSSFAPLGTPSDAMFYSSYLDNDHPIISRLAQIAKDKNNENGYLKMALSVARDRLSSTLLMLDKVIGEVSKC